MLKTGSKCLSDARLPLDPIQVFLFLFSFRLLRPGRGVGLILYAFL